MCGICGLVYADPARVVEESLIRSMCATIVHRGPDDEGVYVSGPVGLGARRLSIIDLEGGHQPLSNEDGSLWIAYNGEVYNFPELRTELIGRGHRFRTRTDTETILHAYEEWGDAFPEQLRGMFAAAVWDGRRNRLLLVRDRMGIKPLYYTLLKDGALVFGSELKSILTAPGIERRPEPRALDLFLTLEYIPAPLSIFQGIHKLPAGHILIFEKGACRIEQYWGLNPESVNPARPAAPEQLADELYDLLREAVRMRLLSDVPLGAFLSGGIDSSCIVGLMRELGATPLKTFSIGFEDATYNELDHARRIARRFDTEHEEFTLQPRALDLTEKLISHLDEPFGDFSIFPTYMVSEMARRRVTVILSGDGGDELFAGYEHYQAQKLAGCPLVAPLGRMVSPLIRSLPPSPGKKGLWNKTQRFFQGFDHDAALRHFRWMMFLSLPQKSRLYGDELIRGLSGLESLHRRPPFAEIFDRMDAFDGVTGELYLDLKSYLVDNILVKVDRMSMAASLETRVPLLDHKVVEFAFQLPGRLKLKGWTTKWIFKQAMRRLLPSETIQRKKEGFSIPIKHWLRQDLRDLLCDTLTESRIRGEGLFQWPAVDAMIQSHLKGTANFSHQLWGLLVYHIWQNHYLA